MAAGEGQRWEAGYPKQLALIDHEPVLYRTVRLLRKRGIEPVVTARYRGQWNLFNEHITSPNQLEIDRFWGAQQFSPAIFLYGDCYYTESAIDIMLQDQHTWCFFGRPCANQLKPHGEIYGFKSNPLVLAAAEELRADFLNQVVIRCIGWDLYWRCVDFTCRGKELERLPFINFVAIEDETEDFDSLEEYQQYLQHRGI